MSTNIGGIAVEWYENKNYINIKKHGISFETAALVFADEERIEYYDKLHSLNEDRYVVIGCVQGVLFVVYTMRSENARIISARMATGVSIMENKNTSAQSSHPDSSRPKRRFVKSKELPRCR